MTRQQQISTVTTRGRHRPLIEDAARTLASLGSTGAPLRVLSFGCSTGAECLDMADAMPDAAIVGCDINPKALAAARETCGDRVAILESGSEALAAAGPFDVVFALSVLCRYPQTAGLDDVSALYPFGLFEDGVAQVDGYVKPGGLLVLYNAQYFFEDTPTARAYRSHGGGVFDRTGWIEKSLPDGRRVTDVTWRFDGEEFSRADFATWMRIPANKQRAADQMDRLTYRHAWRDAASAQTRTTVRPIWIKTQSTS